MMHDCPCQSINSVALEGEYLFVWPINAHVMHKVLQFCRSAEIPLDQLDNALLSPASQKWTV